MHKEFAVPFGTDAFLIMKGSNISSSSYTVSVLYMYSTVGVGYTHFGIVKMVSLNFYFIEILRNKGEQILILLLSLISNLQGNKQQILPEVVLYYTVELETHLLIKCFCLIEISYRFKGIYVYASFNQKF
jgi:hypothetical protein